jgi:hypothetical protein
MSVEQEMGMDLNSLTQPDESAGRLSSSSSNSSLCSCDSSSELKNSLKNPTWQAIVAEETSLDKLVMISESDFALTKLQAMEKVLEMMRAWDRLRNSAADFRRLLEV